MTETSITRSEDNVTREPSSNRTKVASPLVDVYESSDEFLVLADVPGVDESSVKITLERNLMVLEAERSAQRNGRGLKYRREFELSDAIDGDGITAELEQGVLQVHLPKSSRAKPRRIEVRAG